MSVNPSVPRDPATDRAAALLHRLDELKSDGPMLAEPMERLVARLIDLVVLTLLALAISAVPAWVHVQFFVDTADKARTGAPGSLEPGNPMPAPLEWAVFLATIASVAAYEVIPTARTGQNLAKRRMNLRVTDSGGKAPGYRRSVVRFLVWWGPLASAVAFFGATFGTSWGLLAICLEGASLLIPGSIFWNSDHIGIHDRIAGTRVVASR